MIQGSTRRRVAAETLRDWPYAYRLGGFDALKPRSSRDTRHTRALPQAVADLFCALKEAPFGSRRASGSCRTASQHLAHPGHCSHLATTPEESARSAPRGNRATILPLAVIQHAPQVEYSCSSRQSTRKTS
jgi:hypothetical protein